MPIWTPAGTMVPASDEVDPTRRRSWYSRSVNSARRRLKPVVFMLAMLFEMTSTLSCWASIPVAAMLRDLMCRILPCYSYSGGRNDRVDDAALQLVLGFDHALGGLEVAHHRHQQGQLDHRADVRFLDHTLDDFGRQVRQRRRGRLVQAAGYLAQFLLVGEAHDIQAVDRAALGGNRAVGCDDDLAVIRRNDDRAAGAAYGMAFAGHQLAFGVELETAEAD